MTYLNETDKKTIVLITLSILIANSLMYIIRNSVSNTNISNLNKLSLNNFNESYLRLKDINGIDLSVLNICIDKGLM